jgi:pimeloyl-ACP methyl ester carboxylesterase
MGAVKVTLASLGPQCKRLQSPLWVWRLRTISAMAAPNPYAQLIAATPVREATLELLGSSTHYWVYGPADAPLTIVAVHGFRGEHHGLEPIVVQLDGVRVISPDLPGFGESTPMTEAKHDIEGYAHWLTAFVDALGLPVRPIILGHSFGSIVVAAAVAGGLVTPKLILINPIAAPALHGPKAFITSLAIFYYWAGAKLPRPLGNLLLGSRVITRFISQVMVTADKRQLRRWIHEQHRTYFSRFADRDMLLEAFRASTGNNVIEYAPKITVPTLLIAAGNDPITKIADEEKLRDLLPDATLHVLPKVGHLIHYERPGDAAALIAAFLGVQSLGVTAESTSR